MDKRSLLSNFYRAEISALIDKTNDVVLLDLIHRLLTKEASMSQEEKKNAKN